MFSDFWSISMYVKRSRHPFASRFKFLESHRYDVNYTLLYAATCRFFRFSHWFRLVLAVWLDWAINTTLLRLGNHCILAWITYSGGQNTAADITRSPLKKVTKKKKKNQVLLLQTQPWMSQLPVPNVCFLSPQTQLEMVPRSTQKQPVACAHVEILWKIWVRSKWMTVVLLFCWVAWLLSLKSDPTTPTQWWWSRWDVLRTETKKTLNLMVVHEIIEKPSL